MSTVVSLLLAVGLFGADPIVDLVKSTPTPYPKADAVVILDKREITLKEDGYTFEKEEFVVKVLNKQGKERYGNRSYMYDSNLTAMKITEARVIKPTGEVVGVPEEGINEVTPWGLSRTPAYGYAKQTTISFVGLEVGDAIHLKREVKSRYPLGFGGHTFFGGLNPIVTKILKVNVPREKELKWKVIGKKIDSKIVKNEHFISYTWKGSHLPQVVMEPNMPSFYTVVPRLVYTTNKTWQEAGKKFVQLFNRPSEGEDTSQKALQITGSVQQRDEIIERLFLYVVNEIRSIHQAVGTGRYQPRKPGSLVESGYGNAVDKVGFLVSSLNSLGIDAYPVLISNSDVEIIKEVPLLSQFSSLIITVPSQRKRLWLDPFASNWRYGILPAAYEGRDCLIVSKKDARFERTPRGEPANHLSSKKCVFELEEDGTLSGRMELYLQGDFDSQSRRILKEKTKREKEVYVHTSCNRLSPGTELISYQLSDLKDLTSRAECTVKFRSPRYASKSGNLLIFEVPTCPFHFANAQVSATLGERKHPFILDNPLCDEYEAIFEIPRGYKAKYLPARLSLKNPVGTLDQTCKITEGKVKCTSKLVLKKQKIEPKKYHYLKDLLDSRSLPKNRLMILESSS